MRGCARTPEVEQLLRLGHWPQAAGEELATHARECRKCRETVLLTQALSAAKASAMIEARVEPAALVWWRAQLRRRREMVQRVERPVLAQMLVLGVVVCVGLGLAFRLSGGMTTWRAWMSAATEAGVGSFGVGLAVLSAVALAMMAGLAVYLTVDRK